jgi:3-methyladenine DNA glycosylase AlkD
MSAKEILAELKALGTAQNRKIYTRHGGDPKTLYGVSFAHIGAIAKRVKRNHALAEGLFKSGIFEANYLAAQIADPALASDDDLCAWIDGAASYGDADEIGASLVARSANAKKLALALTKGKTEKRERAGWAAIGQMLKTGKPEWSAAEVTKLLATIEKGIHKQQNRTREVMLWVMIGIGICRPDLRDEALAAAGRIGPVYIDHGETGCKTPDAVDYIKKAAARQASKK